MTIRSKLLLVVIPPMILGIFIFGTWSINLVKQNTLKDHQELISLYLGSIVNEYIDRRVNLLLNTGLHTVPSYVKDYQKEAIKDINKETQNNNRKIIIFDKLFNKIEGINYSKDISDNLFKSLLDKNSISGYFKKNNQDYFYVSYYYKPWEWTIVAYESDEMISKFIANIAKIIFMAAFIISFIIIVLIYVVTSRVLIAPIVKLKKAASLIANGNLEDPIYISGNDEISLLSKDFESMRIVLRERIELFNEQIKFRQLLIDSIDLPIYIKDEKLNFINCNDAFAKFLNISKEKLLKNKNIDNNHVLKILEPIEKEVLQKQENKRSELEITNEKNENIDVILNQSIFTDKATKNSGLVTSIFDITHLNEAKRKAESFNEELQKSVNFKTHELQVTNEKLQKTIENLKLAQNDLIESEKMASLGGLVAGVAHEINTPVGISLTSITYFDEILKDIKNKYKNENMSEEFFEEFLTNSKEITDLITTSLKRTAQLVKSFKQIAVDQSSEEKRIFNFKEYLEEIIFSLNSILKNTKVDLKIVCEENIIIENYPGIISQIITNLLLNSVTHGFQINEKGLIQINVRKIDKYIEVKYSDDGCGIPKENLPKIFDPFFTTNRNYGGSGLGLNIIYNLINQKLKGSISCKSEVGKGVTFTFVIPIKTL